MDPTAQIIFDCYKSDGQMSEAALRAVLRRVLDLYAQRGWSPVIAPEMEFYLIATNPDPDIPVTPPVGRTGRAEFGRRSYAIDAVNEFDPLFEDIYDYCHAQNLEVDTLIHEIGTAQMEINFCTATRWTWPTRCFVQAHGARGGVPPWHVRDFHGQTDGRRAGQRHAYAPERDRHRQRAQCVLQRRRQPVAGVLSLHRRLAALSAENHAVFAPYVNSYRRLTPYTAAPTNVQWGFDNRTVGLRVPLQPGGAPGGKPRAGVDVNPYIAMAASLACGYLGMVNQIDCAEPVQINAYSLPYELPRGTEDALSNSRPARKSPRFLARALSSCTSP